jgi:hypothetical protein
MHPAKRELWIGTAPNIDHECASCPRQCAHLSWGLRMVEEAQVVSQHRQDSRGCARTRRWRSAPMSIVIGSERLVLGDDLRAITAAHRAIARDDPRGHRQSQMRSAVVHRDTTQRTSWARCRGRRSYPLSTVSTLGLACRAQPLSASCYVARPSPSCPMPRWKGAECNCQEARSAVSAWPGPRSLLLLPALEASRVCHSLTGRTRFPVHEVYANHLMALRLSLPRETRVHPRRDSSVHRIA